MASLTFVRLLWSGSNFKVASKTISSHVNRSNFIVPHNLCQRGFFSKRKDKNDNQNNEIAEAPPAGFVVPPPSSTPVIVYSGTMDHQVYNVKHFSLFTSFAIVCMQPIVYYRMDELSSPILKAVLGSSLAFFFLATPILIHSFTKKYVLSLTLDNETKEFVATTYSLFLRKKQLKFTQADIVVPPTPLPFTTVYAKGVPLLLGAEGWKSRYAYDHFMLLEKTPIDWSKLKSDKR